MKLTILGSGTCVPSLKRSSPANFLKILNRNVIIDFGPGTMHQMIKTKIDYKKIDFVFLTHFHSDHVSELRSFIQALDWTPNFNRKKDLILIGPVGFKEFYKRTINSKPRPNTYQIKIKEIKKNLAFGNLKVECVRTVHSEESIAYKFTEKTKSIIIISAAIIIFALLVAMIFGLFPSKKQEVLPENKSAKQVILPDKSESMPKNKVFSASNAKEFSDLSLPGSSSGISSLEKEAKELAEFFVERFGTYSSDANFANIDDLVGFMTPSLRSKMGDYKKNAPKRGSYYSVSSEVALIDTKSFSLKNRSASFDIVVNRKEETGKSVNSYQQNVEV